MRLFGERKNWFERMNPEDQERYKWSVIAQDQGLIRPGERPTVAEVKKRFEEKLYQPRDAG